MILSDDKRKRKKETRTFRCGNKSFSGCNETEFMRKKITKVSPWAEAGAERGGREEKTRDATEERIQMNYMRCLNRL